MSLSIILPVYNPADNWIERIKEHYAIIEANIPGPIQLVIVNDGSIKGIEEQAVNTLRAHVRDVKWISYKENRGKGFAIRQGVKQATGDILIYTDIDFPYDLTSFMDIHAALTSGNCDIAVGVKNEAYYNTATPARKKISKGLRYLIRVFYSIPITDTQCGLKGFSKKVSPLFLETTIDRYLFDLEFLKKAFKSKQYRIQAIPIQLNDNVVFSKMNYKLLLPEMINFVKLLFR